jgi:DNA-binding transcriptional LysR family regulator
MGRNRLPSLKQIQAFEATARHLSFSKAADELHVTHAAVSHQVKALEEYLQTRLFDRLTRAIRLTPEAEVFYQDVHAALNQIGAAAEKFLDHQLRGELNITAAPSFATRWLLPNLPKFKSQFPEISVELQPTMEIVDLGDGTTDLAIRHGSGKWPGLESEKLFDEMIIPVAAVSLSKTLDKEKFWRGQTLLSASPRKGEWEHWFKARRGRKSESQEMIYYPTQALALDAAVSGLGIALADYRLVAGDLKCGRLVQLQAEPILNKRAFYAVYRKGSAADARIRVFCDWLSDSLI